MATTSRSKSSPPSSQPSKSFPKNTGEKELAIKANKKAKHKKKLAQKAVASTRPAKPVQGASSSTRKLFVTPSTERISRIPVWARPPTAAFTQKPTESGDGGGVESGGRKNVSPDGLTWSEHRAKLKEKYPEPWNPSKKVSREAMDAIRELYKADPDKYPSHILAERFSITQEAVKRILRSRWRMKEEQTAERVMRQRKMRVERMKAMREEEMHQMVRAGIKLKVHPDDQLELR